MRWSKEVTCSNRPACSNALRLEEVYDHKLLIDTFDLGRIDPSQIEEETVIRELPGGKLRAFRRPVFKEQPSKDGRKGTRRRPAHESELDYNLMPVEYSQLLAICILSLR